jgi:uncharacterized damage-inducible protein DinB
MLCYLVDYMAWADQEVLAACSALSPEDLDRSMAISHAGILGTLRHMFIAERDWLRRLQASVSPPITGAHSTDAFADLPPDAGLDTLLEGWPSIWEGFQSFAAAVSEQDLDGDFAAMDTRILRWKLMLHVVNHPTLHRGQVVGMLRQLGLQPPSTDQFTYHRLHPQAAIGAHRS